MNSDVFVCSLLHDQTIDTVIVGYVVVHVESALVILVASENNS